MGRSAGSRRRISVSRASSRSVKAQGALLFASAFFLVSSNSATEIELVEALEDVERRLRDA